MPLKSPCSGIAFIGSVIIAVMIIGHPFMAEAHGLGIYINSPGGLNRLDSGLYSEFDGPTSIAGRSHRESGTIGYGCGIMMDTDPDSERLFNYRIYTGYERKHVLISNTINLHAVRWSNAFGFRLFRNDLFKVWLGPAFGLDYLWGRDSHSTGEFISNYMLLGPPFNGIQPVRYTRRYGMIGLNIGVALGVNINFTRSVTLSVEAGCRVYNMLSLKDTDAIPPSGDIQGLEGYLLIGFLGRVN